MKLKVFHQLGFRYNWNIDSLVNDRCGDGLILAPRYMPKDFVDKMDPGILHASIFDPQFFLPDTPKGNLETYEFFPHVSANGFETVDFIDNHASTCASRCVKYQKKLGVSYITIPARYFSGLPSGLITQQKKLFVDDFIAEIENNDIDKPVLLQLVLNELMVKDDDYISDILNWVTGCNIDGVYLIVEKTSTSKQTKDSDLLLSLLNIVTSLKDNGLIVVIGYLNTESLLLSLADPDIVTIGAYENMRSFSIKAFQESEKTVMQGPNPRLYMSQLLQWVEYPYVGMLRRIYPKGEIFDDTTYRAEMFEKAFNWHFSKPELYKHHFVVIASQLDALSKLDGKDRFKLFSEMTNSAISKYNELSEKGMVFDGNSDGSHLYIWSTVANLYASKMGWGK
ncbi:MAG: hypothetical protein HGA96_05910 [Desulfobulbaceae bacterium]|nr:hypothetical protein [Desulfobulbaceae bacterium]